MDSGLLAPREGNAAAHSLAQWGINQNIAGVIRLDSLSSDVTDCDMQDG